MGGGKWEKGDWGAKGLGNGGKGAILCPPVCFLHGKNMVSSSV